MLPNDIEKESGLGWEVRKKEIERNRMRGNHNQNILYEKSLFSIKDNKDQLWAYTMPQEVNACTTKFDDMSSMCGSHMMVGTS